MPARERAPATPWVVGCLLWMGGMVLHSHLPGGLYADTPLEGAHRPGIIGGYAVLGVLGVGGIARLLPKGPRPLWGSLTLIVGAMLGALNEFQQRLLSGGTGAMEDWLTGVLGLAIVVIIARAARGGLARVWLGEGREVRVEDTSPD